MRAFPRKRLVKHCTMRFRGNAMGATAGAITIRADARWPVSYALKTWSPAVENKVAGLVKAAVS